jgi:hypothetical protein
LIDINNPLSDLARQGGTINTCPTCGAESLMAVRRGDLIVSPSPPSVFWREEWVPMRPSDAGVLFLLVRDGFVSLDTIFENAPLSAHGSNLPAVRVANIRRALVKAGVPAKVTSSRGQGYRLEWLAGNESPEMVLRAKMPVHQFRRWGASKGY